MAVRAGRFADRQLLRRVGRRCTWQQALLCPCQQYDGAQGPPCPSCERGYLYQPGELTKVLMVGDSRKETSDLAGLWESGEAFGTFAAHLWVGHQDKVIVEDFPVRDNLIVTRSSTTKDTLRQPHVVDLLAVRTKDVAYTKGANFQLSEDANGNSVIEWLSGGPTAGENYSVLLTCKMVWIVENHEFVRGLTGKRKDQLPKKVRLLRWDRAVEGVSA